MITWLKNLNDKLRGWRTFIVSAVIAAVGALEQTPWADVVPDQYKKYALVAVPIIFALMRLVSNGPAGSSK